MTSHQDAAGVVAKLDRELNRCGHEWAFRPLVLQAKNTLEAQAKALSEAEADRDAARDSAADARMLAFKWMERHDKISAGKDGGAFPKPADLPEAIARALAAEARLAAEERSHIQTIDERDNYHQWADRLAHAIGGDEIGEHSNLNNPWANALELAFTNAAKEKT